MAKIILGSNRNDSLNGSAGNDYIFALAGNDTLMGKLGNDFLNGGTGSDTVDYTYATSNLNIKLDSSSRATVSVGAGDVDKLAAIENLIGGSGNDILTGNSLANVLKGGIGNDVLDGGKGNDILTGGAGADTFVIDVLHKGNVNKDIVTDFNRAEGDKIQLPGYVLSAPKYLFGKASQITNANIAIGSAAVDANDFLIYNPKTGQLFYDADGIGNRFVNIAAVEIAVLGNTTHPTSLLASDFVFSGSAVINPPVVADMPTLKVTTVNTGLHQVKLEINAALTDTDGSETLSVYLNNVPSSVKVTGAHWDSGVNKYVVDNPKNVTFNLPATGNSAFNPTVEAVAKELFNDDIATKTEQLSIKENNFSYTFVDNNQNMWGAGDALGIYSDKFYGLDFNKSIDNGILAGSSVSAKLGIESKLDVHAGKINAGLPYDFSFNTVYNKTADTLAITPYATLNKAYFETLSPQLKYDLNFIAQANAHLKAKALGVTLIDKDVFNVNWNKNLIHLDSDSLETTIPLPLGSELKLAAPQLDTVGKIDSPTDTSVTSSGVSNNFADLKLDVDKIITAITGIPLNVDFSGKVLGVNYKVGINLLDIDLTGALNFIQKFQMDVKNLEGSFKFENQSGQKFGFGQTTLISNASQLDVNKDGNIAFNSLITPHATMNNDTDLGIKVGYTLDVLSANIHADTKVLWKTINVDRYLDPVIHLTGNFVNASLPIFDQTFDMGFTPQGFDMFA